MATNLVEKDKADDIASMTQDMEDFALETRLIVLNYMGLLPVTPADTTSLCSSSSGSKKSSDGGTKAKVIFKGDDFSHGEPHQLPTRQVDEDPSASLVSGPPVPQEMVTDGGQYLTVSDRQKLIRPTSLTDDDGFHLNVARPGTSESDASDYFETQGRKLSASELFQGSETGNFIPEENKSDPHDIAVSESSSEDEDLSPSDSLTSPRCGFSAQVSQVSLPEDDLTNSGRSFQASRASTIGSSASTYISVTQTDPQVLMRYNSMQADLVTPLKEELQTEWSRLEKEKEASVKKRSMVIHKSGTPVTEEPPSPCTCPQSPDAIHAEVAKKLSIIGDEVAFFYGKKIDHAVREMISLPREQVTFSVFTDVLEHEGLLTTEVQQWNQVVILLRLSQQLTWAMLRRGERGLSQLVDFTTHLIAEKAASFIIRQGGWGAVSELELDSPVHSFDMPETPKMDDEDSILRRRNLSDIPEAPILRNGSQEEASNAGYDGLDNVANTNASPNVAAASSDISRVRSEINLLRQHSENLPADMEADAYLRSTRPLIVAGILVSAVALGVILYRRL